MHVLSIHSLSSRGSKKKCIPYFSVDSIISSGLPSETHPPYSPQVKTWFQNRRMKHKKQLRKSQDEHKTPGQVERTAVNSSESELTEKSGKELKCPLERDTYLLEESDDDVDIEDDICSPDHLL